MNPALTLIADSGSTKTDWLLTTDTHETAARFQTQGINPFLQTDAEIAASLRLAREALTGRDAPERLCFYGAGCRDAQCERMTDCLKAVWPEARQVEVGSDLLGAAKALFGCLTDGAAPRDGIACILGTGSNSGLFIGGEIVKNVSPLGYILGDEGSGAVLGRRLLGDLLKHQLSEDLEEAFRTQYALTDGDILQRVYREPFANRFLASFAPFLHLHREEPAIHRLLTEEFARFFDRNVAQYGRHDLEVAFVGSIAFHFEAELRQVARAKGFRLGKIRRGPLD